MIKINDLSQLEFIADKAGCFCNGKFVTEEYFVCIDDSDTAIASDIRDPMTKEISKDYAVLFSALPEMACALSDALFHLENAPFDYSNGVTDESGCIDEGNVRGWEAHRKVVESIKSAIKKSGIDIK